MVHHDDMADQNGITQVEVADLPDDVVLLDVREPNEYEAGRAAGAVSVPLGELRARVGEVSDAEGPVHVICRSGARSQKAAEFLAGQGLKAVNVTGGTTAWAAAGKPMVGDSGEPSVVAPTTQPPAEV